MPLHDYCNIQALSLQYERMFDTMAYIKQDGDSYRIQVSNGYDVNGKKIRETISFTPEEGLTEKQRKKALDKFVFEFEERVKNGKYLSGEKMTFKEFVDRWLIDYAPSNIEKTSLNNYKDYLDNNIIPELGHLKLTKLQPMHLQGFYNKMLKPGARKDKKECGYSPATIKKLHVIISSILGTAVDWQVIESNPCEKVSPPKQTKGMDDIKFFTLEQTQIFLKALDMEYSTKYKAHTRKDDTGKKYNVPEYTETRRIPFQFKVMYYIALFAGLRKGELVALTWNDIDFKNNSININKSTALTKREVFDKAPKNKTSIRTVTVPDFVMDLIQKYKTEQKELKVKLGDQWQGSDGKDWQNTNHLFIQWNGKQINISTPYQTFKDIIHKYNATVEDESLKLPDIPLHGLRHTSATVLISEDVDVRTVSARLGHAQTSTTMNIYAHSLKESDKKAADKLNNLFKQSQNAVVTK